MEEFYGPGSKFTFNLPYRTDVADMGDITGRLEEIRYGRILSSREGPTLLALRIEQGPYLLAVVTSAGNEADDRLTVLCWAMAGVERGRRQEIRRERSVAEVPLLRQMAKLLVRWAGK